MKPLFAKLRRYAALISIIVTVLLALIRFAWGAHVETSQRIRMLEINMYAVCAKIDAPCIAPPSLAAGDFKRTASNP